MYYFNINDYENFTIFILFSSHEINVTKTRQVLSGDLLPDVALDDVTLLEVSYRIEQTDFLVNTLNIWKAVPL